MTGTFFALAFSTILRRRLGVVGDDDEHLDAFGRAACRRAAAWRRAVALGGLDHDVGLAILRALDEQVAVALPALVQRVHQEANLQPAASRLRGLARPSDASAARDREHAATRPAATSHIVALRVMLALLSKPAQRGSPILSEERGAQAGTATRRSRRVRQSATELTQRVEAQAHREPHLPPATPAPSTTSTRHRCLGHEPRTEAPGISSARSAAAT